jgi:hypothetical protein
MRWHSETSGIDDASSWIFGSCRAAGRDAKDRRQRIAERGRIDVRVVPPDDAAPLEALETLARRRGREVDAPAELGDRQPRFGNEFLQDPAVSRVKFCCFDGQPG